MGPTVEEIVVASVGRMQPADHLMATPEGIRDLIDQLIANLANVDPEEALEIMAQIEKTVIAFTTGNWLLGMRCLAKAFQMYRAAIKD